MKLILTTALSAGLALGATLARAAPDPAGSGVSAQPGEESQPSETQQPGEVIQRHEEVTVEPSEQPAEPGAAEKPAPAEEPTPYMTEPQVKVTTTEVTTHKAEGPGFGILVGGGIFGFGDSAARDATTDIGANYTARVVGGINMPLAFELGYIGTAQNINALGVERDAKLISNGIEGALRINLLTGMVQPYVLGGAAWKRYDVTNTNINVSSLKDHDSVGEFPVGGGIGLHWKQLLLDARGAYRFASGASLFRGADVGLGNWDVGLKAGVAF